MSHDGEGENISELSKVGHVMLNMLNNSAKKLLAEYG